MFARSMLTNDKAEIIHLPRPLLALVVPLLAVSIARGHRDEEDELHLLPPLALFHPKATDSGLGTFYFLAP